MTIKVLREKHLLVLCSSKNIILGYGRTSIEYAILKRPHLAYFDKYNFSYKCNLKASLDLLCSKKAKLPTSFPFRVIVSRKAN